jgi:hypothetical protein
MGVAVPTWPLRVAAEAAQVPEKTTSRWRNNDVITLGGNDVTTTGTGNHCGWSRNRILQLAITQALVKNGVSPSIGANRALEFSDKSGAGRAAGQLLPLGSTVLVIRQHDAVVANVDPDARVSDLSNNGVCIVLDLNKIAADVDSVLNSYN